MKNKSRWLRLLLGVVTLLFAGIIYAWTAINTPFKALAESETELMLNYTVTMCMFCISGFFSGLLSKKISERIRLFASAVLVAGGLVIVSLVTKENFFLLYLGYGVMMGSGVGIVYNVVISATNAWFPDKKGIASGALMMGFGLGSFFIGIIGKALFDAISWQKTYLLFAAVIGVVLVAAALLVRSPEKSNGIIGSDDGMETGEVVKRASFWKLAVFFTLFAAVGSTAISGASDMMGKLGVVSGISVLALLVPVCNSLGRIVCGIIFDKAGRRITQFITSGVVILATGTALVGFITETPIVGVAGLLLCGFSYGFSPTVSSAFTAEFYGMKNFSLNFSLLNLILIPASFAPTMSGALVTATGSYVPTFAILLALSLMGLIINVTIKKK